MTQPVLAGWFTLDEHNPRLIGSRCRACGTYHFPPQSVYCRNPACVSDSFEQVQLSNTGTLWSFTNACYAPPLPYYYEGEFEPYAIAAVELEQEKMVVLGQAVRGTGVDDLQVGMNMELALETIAGEHGERLTWKWRPAGDAA